MKNPNIHFSATLCVFFLCALCGKIVFAQTTKGVKLISTENSSATTGKTYALIIGISKYQNAGIPQLQYADKDAYAFYEYLKATGVDTNNMILRLNENARCSNILLDCYKLCVETAKKGDKIFIYFSGHGDVESKVITNLGYLLPYDAPTKVYSTSALDLRILQDYMSTASASGVEVILITDACHSGNLAGGIDGLHNIQNVLKQSWKDEIKILSCQPGELSIEGRQWGNGRGLFSYELIKGMAGAADKNNDGKVSLYELNLYLSEKVHEEANPFPQNPMITGNMDAEIAIVTEGVQNKTSSSSSSIAFASIDTKGMEDGLLRNQPDTIKKLYALFKACLDTGDLGTEHKEIRISAFECLKRIPENESTKLLIGLMKRNLSAAMINDINATVNKAINNETYLNNGYGFSCCDDYYSDLTYLLGKSELNNIGMMAKIVYNKALKEGDILSNPSDNVFYLLDSAIKIDPNASYALGMSAQLLASYRSNLILAMEYSKRAIEISPKFAYPYRTLADAYLYMNKPDSCILISRKLKDIDTAKFNNDVNDLLACSYFLLNQVDSSDFYFNKHFKIQDYKQSDWTLNQSYEKKAKLLLSLKEFSQAIPYYELSLELHKKDKITGDEIKKDANGRGLDYSIGSISEISNEYYQISCCYSMMNKKDSAIFYFTKALDEGIKNFKYIPRNPKFDYFSKALNEGFKNTNHVPPDLSLDNIRNSPEFKKLMAKYFPDKEK